LNDEKQMDQNHLETITQLEKDKEKYEKQYKALYDRNTKEETELRKTFSKSHNIYKDIMAQYDNELKNHTRDNEKTQTEFEDTVHELNYMKEEYHMLLEEKRKRDTIATFMKKKQDQQNEKMDKLIRASEYIQAHWRGMLDRKIAEKARKKSKKKRGKKK